MVKIVYPQPYDQLYHLTKQREKIAFKADQLAEMAKPYALKHEENYTLTITSKGARIESKHRKSIQKALKNLNKSYQKRLAKKEEEIKKHIQDHLTQQTHDNQE